MTTFKDLLSKTDIDTLKSTLKSTAKDDPQTGKPTEAVLPSQKQIERQASRLGATYVDDDKVLFMQAMSGVTPIKSQPNIQHTPPKDPNAQFKRAAAVGGQEDHAVPLSDMQALLNPVASEAFLTYKNPTLPTKTFEQLKQGKLRWYEAVDLHSSSIDEARLAVLQLINIAKDANQTVIKIVHGKGDSLLKTCVNGWLRQIDEVLAFVSAPAKDGGTGAVLVLLKRQKDQDRPQT